MPIFFQQEINENTRLAVWKIEEEESFFTVPLQRQITHPHKRLQHLAGRYLLKHLFPDFPLDLIKVADTRKPYLEDEAFHFSISHCSDYAAAIISRNKRVGVDIEVPTPKVEKIKHKFLHPEELAMLNVEYLMRTTQQGTINNECSTNQLITLLWSAKEAVFKWWSFGNVDFSEMIRFDSFPASAEGQLEARFLAREKEHHLLLQYRFFQNLCLVWVMNEKHNQPDK